MKGVGKKYEVFLKKLFLNPFAIKITQLLPNKTKLNIDLEYLKKYKF